MAAASTSSAPTTLATARLPTHAAVAATAAAAGNSALAPASAPASGPASGSVTGSATTTTTTTTTLPGTLPGTLRPYRTVLAAAAAGTCGVVIGYPFDFVKTRMQTHGFTSMGEVVRTTLQHEGARGFFRGMIPPLFTVSFVKAVSFHTFETTKASLTERRVAAGGQGDALADVAASGFVAGTTIAVVSGPLELVKIQMQLGALMRRLDPAAPVFNGSVACARYIVKRHGIAGLYKGFSCHFLRDSFGTALYFWLYEGVHRIASPTGRRADASPWVHFMAGGAAGVGCWLVVFPVDLVKSRLQKDACLPRPVYRGVRDCVRSMYRSYGMLGFYSGLWPTLIRAFPIHSVNFLVYESVMKFLE